MNPSAADALAKEIEEVALLVHSAEDRRDDRDFVARAHQGVQQLVEKYRELSQSGGGSDPVMFDRKFGRKVRDIQRLAALLPRIGAIASSTPDRQVQGASIPGERKITGVSWRSTAKPANTNAKVTVGADVEAWCGTCKELTNHSIFAVVNDQPKIVTCQTCNARHNFRTNPARTRSTASNDESNNNQVYAATASRGETDRKRNELDELARELSVAENVIEFDPQRRYRVGEVISHPEFGRGKVQTVLRSSMLVRFGRGGMKSIMLI